MDRRRLAAGGGRARSPFSTAAVDSSAPGTWRRASGAAERTERYRTAPGGTGLRAGAAGTGTATDTPVCPSPVPRSGAGPDSAERGRSQSRRPRGAEPAPRPSRHRAPVPGALIGTGVGWGGGHRLPVPGGTPVGQSRVISAPPHRGPRTRAPGTAERRNERRKRSGTGGGARGAGRGGGGGGRAAAPGRKESGEGGGVNIEYLLIAVEGRSVITGPSSPGGGRRGRCMQRWCRDPRPRAPSGVRGAAGGGRGGALAYRWP